MKKHKFLSLCPQSHNIANKHFYFSLLPGFIHHMNPFPIVTTESASSRLLHHLLCHTMFFCCFFLCVCVKAVFHMPRSENTSIQCDKTTHSKCSIAIIGNICLHRKEVNMLLAVLLFAWEEFYWRTSFILIPKTLRCAVAMITKHGNESDRQYCFHSNVEVKVCVWRNNVPGMTLFEQRWQKIVATLSPE